MRFRTFNFAWFLDDMAPSKGKIQGGKVRNTLIFNHAATFEQIARKEK